MNALAAVEIPLSRARSFRVGTLPLLGPAFVTAIAYVDPGNFATNFAAGSSYGYLLVWVVLASSVMAALVQYLSAKIGIASGKSLPQLCADHFPKAVNVGLWLQAEAVAMATDLAEVLGGALALNLLFRLPLLAGGLVTAAVAIGLLTLTERGHRPFERAVVGMLAVILSGFVASLCVSGFSVPGVVGGVLPHFAGTNSIVLAGGIVGATVMPHAIYMHSALTAQRVASCSRAQKRALFKAQCSDIPIAMGLAGLVNLAMLVLAAAVFSGSAAVATLQAAGAGLGSALGSPAAVLFSLALLASGLAASSVGTYSGQVVMEGFLGLRPPMLLRRLVTMAPALGILLLGVDPTRAVLLSQIALSFGIPFALVPLVMLTSRSALMGEYVNMRRTTAVGGLVAAVICALNAFLIAQLLA